MKTFNFIVCFIMLLVTVKCEDQLEQGVQDGDFVPMEDGEVPFDMEAAMAEFDKETEPMDSLQEIIDVGTGKAFDKLTYDPNGNLKKMLNLCIKKTGITPKYLTKLFFKISGVTSTHGLKEINFQNIDPVDFINDVIKHFQEFPMAGRAEPAPSATPPTEEHHVRDEL